ARQARFEGSDRQVRGLLLRELRASETPLPELLPEWPDAAQRERALAGLIADGLVALTDEGYALPS
ncbi:MAG TPA: A/G-specific adenine glycosylase, partial [Rhodoglobus sp.]|nr:A/G-specific adenine glycosylase [Rhodoglobus sp.]